MGMDWFILRPIQVSNDFSLSCPLQKGGGSRYSETFCFPKSQDEYKSVKLGALMTVVKNMLGLGEWYLGRKKEEPGKTKTRKLLLVLWPHRGLIIIRSVEGMCLLKLFAVGYTL